MERETRLGHWSLITSEHVSATRLHLWERQGTKNWALEKKCPKYHNLYKYIVNHEYQIQKNLQLLLNHMQQLNKTFSRLRVERLNLGEYDI
jgi:hypothetical protein